MSLGCGPAQVAGNVNAPALLAIALEHSSDRVDQAAVGIADHELDGSQATLLLLCRSLRLQRANELGPEALALAATQFEAELLPTARSAVVVCLKAAQVSPLQGAVSGSVHTISPDNFTHSLKAPVPMCSAIVA